MFAYCVAVSNVPLYVVTISHGREHSLFIWTRKDFLDERKKVNAATNGEARRALFNAAAKTKRHTRSKCIPFIICIWYFFSKHLPFGYDGKKVDKHTRVVHPAKEEWKWCIYKCSRRPVESVLPAGDNDLRKYVNSSPAFLCHRVDATFSRRFLAKSTLTMEPWSLVSWGKNKNKNKCNWKSSIYACIHPHSHPSSAYWPAHGGHDPGTFLLLSECIVFTCQTLSNKKRKKKKKQQQKILFQTSLRVT